MQLKSTWYILVEIFFYHTWFFFSDCVLVFYRQGLQYCICAVEPMLEIFWFDLYGMPWTMRSVGAVTAPAIYRFELSQYFRISVSRKITLRFENTITVCIRAHVKIQDFIFILIIYKNFASLDSWTNQNWNFRWMETCGAQQLAKLSAAPRDNTHTHERTGYSRGWAGRWGDVRGDRPTVNPTGWSGTGQERARTIKQSW